MARFSSIDALRGLTVAAMLLVNNAGDWDHVYPWLEHAQWNGCNPADFIFPFFLLIVGVSINLAYSSKIAAGGSLSELKKTVLLRGVRIVLLGVALHLIACFLIDGRAFRLMGILQRIGICFTVVGLIHLTWHQARTQWALIAAILLGYWMLLISGTAPNHNLSDTIDTLLLGARAYQYDPVTHLAHDPEGILGTLPAVATVLLGVRAGDWLRNGQIRQLLSAGVACVILGALWSLVLPLNKQLWTSSFVLWTAGFGMLAIGLMHYLIDQRNWPAVGKSFGVNAIAAYAGSWIGICLLYGTGAFDAVYQALFAAPLASTVSPEFASFMFSLAFTAVFAVIMKVMAIRLWRIVI
ncbi:putative acyltransferase [Oxalobacteraceae bacterium GrIS 2.11]